MRFHSMLLRNCEHARSNRDPDHVDYFNNRRAAGRAMG